MESSMKLQGLMHHAAVFVVPVEFEVPKSTTMDEVVVVSEVAVVQKEFEELAGISDGSIPRAAGLRMWCLFEFERR